MYHRRSKTLSVGAYLHQLASADNAVANAVDEDAIDERVQGGQNFKCLVPSILHMGVIEKFGEKGSGLKESTRLCLAVPLLAELLNSCFRYMVSSCFITKQATARCIDGCRQKPTSDSYICFLTKHIETASTRRAACQGMPLRTH